MREACFMGVGVGGCVGVGGGGGLSGRGGVGCMLVCNIM